jgi:hypothetical protein
MTFSKESWITGEENTAKLKTFQDGGTRKCISNIKPPA